MKETFTEKTVAIRNKITRYGCTKKKEKERKEKEIILLNKNKTM